jgi:hypothetical protein
MRTILGVFASLVLLIGAGATYYNQPTVGAALPSATASFETSLQSAITSSASSMTLTANAIRGGGALSGYNCFTIDEGTAQSETVCGTVSGTAVSSMTRGISQATGTTTVASLQFAHRRGANVKITDFPIIQIMKAQLNGEDTIPNLITYADTVLIGVGSPTTTLTTKHYVDGVAVAGASNADDTTKGIVEMATAAEAAAGTSVGGTAARLALGANLATSTPTASCTTFCIVGAVSGKIAQAFIDLTAAFTWTGLHRFDAGFISTASSTVSAQLNLSDLLVMSSTTATSTIAGNLAIAKNASTTNLWISGTCVGCLEAYERLTNTGAGPTTGSTEATVAVNCSAGKKVLGGGSSDATDTGVYVKASYPSDEDTWTVIYRSDPAGAGANTITAYALCAAQ